MVEVEKREFVRLLGVILTCAGEPVSECFLNVQETHVYIQFENGYTQKINVEGDSHLAIMMDIAKALM